MTTVKSMTNIFSARIEMRLTKEKKLKMGSQKKETGRK
jgi:hypothetical protein